MGKLTIEKLNSIVDYFDINVSEYDTFIETGTYLGETVEMMYPYFDYLHSIEVSEYLYNKYFEEHQNYESVTIHLGDSVKVIPKLLIELDKNSKCVFWLDGHFSSGVTSKGEKDCPLIEECVEINNTYKSDQCLILIDDLRLFGTNITEDWTDISIDKITQSFKNFDVKCYEHPDDMLCLFINKK